MDRASFDGNYRVEIARADDVAGTVEALKQAVTTVYEEQCDSVYFVASGTKLQAISIEVLRRQGVNGRLLLGYSIPKSYERRLYSQGSGATHIGVITS